MKILTGHTSPDTAYVVDDYPYGFRLRCKMRYWIETKPKHGQRLCTQSTNPKVAWEQWNKPKLGIYSDVLVMFLDEENHVATAGLGGYDDEPKIDAFVEKYGDGLTGEYERRRVRILTATSRAQKRVVVTHEPLKPGEVPQTVAEQHQIMMRATAYELKKMDGNK